LAQPRFACFERDCQRALCRFLDRICRIHVGIDPVEIQPAPSDTESGPGNREFWIELDGFSIITRRLSNGVVTVLAVLERLSAQISIVGRGVLSRFGGYGSLF